MINTILSQFFTNDVVSNMGSYWYEIVYSWSVFALIVVFALSSLVCLWALISTLLRWFR